MEIPHQDSNIRHFEYVLCVVVCSCSPHPAVTLSQSSTADSLTVLIILNYSCTRTHSLSVCLF